MVPWSRRAVAALALVAALVLAGCSDPGPPGLPHSDVPTGLEALAAANETMSEWPEAQLLWIVGQEPVDPSLPVGFAGRSTLWHVAYLVPDAVHVVTVRHGEAPNRTTFHVPANLSVPEALPSIDTDIIVQLDIHGLERDSAQAAMTYVYTNLRPARGHGGTSLLDPWSIGFPGHVDYTWRDVGRGTLGGADYAYSMQDDGRGGSRHSLLSALADAQGPVRDWADDAVLVEAVGYQTTRVDTNQSRFHNLTFDGVLMPPDLPAGHGEAALWGLLYHSPSRGEVRPYWSYAWRHVASGEAMAVPDDAARYANGTLDRHGPEGEPVRRPNAFLVPALHADYEGWEYRLVPFEDRIEWHITAWVAGEPHDMVVDAFTAEILACGLPAQQDCRTQPRW